jgi:hypothetical protein
LNSRRQRSTEGTIEIIRESCLADFIMPRHSQRETPFDTCEQQSTIEPAPWNRAQNSIDGTKNNLPINRQIDNARVWSAGEPLAAMRDKKLASCIRETGQSMNHQAVIEKLSSSTKFEC